MARRDAFESGATAPPNSVAARCGIEQEFYVFREDIRIDFREVIHTLAIPGARIDPGDRNAYRMEDGSAVTADGLEAEIASIPIDTVPGFAPGLAALTAQHYESLRGLLPADLSLRGAATHINVSVPSNIADRVVLEYVQTFGPMLQALWDRPNGEGIMIRPRPGRIEFGGECIAGPRLAGVALFCVSSVRRLARDSGNLPRFRLQARPAVERLGVELRRPTYASNFYEAGRSARLAMTNGKETSLTGALSIIWNECRTEAARFGTQGEIRTIDDIVCGRLPLGIEGRPLPPATEGHRIQHSWRATPLAGWSRHDGTAIRPTYDTWDYTIMQCRRGGASWLQVVPRTSMSEFVAAANDPQFQWPVPSRRRSLTLRSQLYRPGTYSRIADDSILSPLERAPGSRWYSVSSQATVTASDIASVSTFAAPATQDRPGKWRTPLPIGMALPAPEHYGIVSTGRTGIPRLPLLIALLLIVIVGLGVVTVFALGGGDDDPQTGPVETPSPQPTNAGAVVPTNQQAPTNSPTVASGIAQPTASPTTQAAPPSPAAQPTALPTFTPVPEPTVAPTPIPGPIIITTQLQFTQIITSVTGACGGAPPMVGQNLSPGSPTMVVLDWTNHTIKVGDSQVSAFNPQTYFTTILYGTGDQRQTAATLNPNGLSGTSSFYPYWSIPAGATCFVTLSTNATVVGGQPPLFP